MRILLISGEFPPMQGGVGDYTREMARALAGQGHRVWALVPQSLQEAYPATHPAAWQTWPRIHNWRWGCWSQVIDAIRQIEPHVVDIQYEAAAYDMRVPAINLLPWRIQRLAKRPKIVVTYHDLLTPYLFPKAGPLRPWLVQLLARHSDAAIVTNAEDLHAAQNWPFTTPTNLFQIPIGSNIAVDPPAGFERAVWRARLGYQPADFVWAYFGFLNESKGGDTLMRALARAGARAQLLMIGDRVGSSDPTNRAYADHVQNLIQALGIENRVRWTGYVTPDQVSAALLSADVVVLPYRDGLSFRRGSLHAALAHGCAIVSTTPRVSLPELRDGENVLLVAPDDPAATGQAVLRLQQDAALRRQIGQGARKLAQQFTWAHIARRTVQEVFSR